MKFEYNPAKSKTNAEKHGLSLEDAAGLWQIPSVEIEARTTGEPRFMLIAKLNNKFYSCIFTKRGETIRLISARRSREDEEKTYHEHIGNKENKS